MRTGGGGTFSSSPINNAPLKIDNEIHCKGGKDVSKTTHKPVKRAGTLKNDLGSARNQTWEEAEMCSHTGWIG